MATKDLNAFLNALFASEGGGDYKVENRYGYIGKYQFGEDALVDIGYYKPDKSKNRDADGGFQYDWIGQWTGKNGADSKEVFLASPDIQDQAAKDWVNLLCKRLHQFKLDQYVGKTVGGVDVTESGIIAAAHLKGYGNAKHPGVIAFLKSDGKADATDANGTHVSKYMRKFAGYTLGCCAKCAVQVLDSDKEPVGGLGFKLMAMGKVIYRGITDVQGRSTFAGGFSAGHELSVLIERLEGGYKEVARFAARATPMVVTLVSPKMLIESMLQPHAGPAGMHEATGVDQARKARHGATSGKKRSTGRQRNAQGNPVDVVQPPQPLPPVADRLQTMQAILLRNVKCGSKDEALSGPAAVKKSRKGELISAQAKQEAESLGRCYKYVKIALQASDMVGCYLSGEHAKDAGSALAKEGFVNLLSNSNHGLEGPMDAPLGAVIVYDVTDASPHGHIEVRVENASGKVVVSDYVSDNPRTQQRGGKKSMEGRGRKVIGIWVKS